MSAGHVGTMSARVGEPAWRTFVEHVAETLDVGPGTSVFEVGCGAGALLFPLNENGYRVGGIDSSPGLVAQAVQAMPHGHFSCSDAAALDPAEPWDVVVACGAFSMFPDLDYARGVLARMAAKATHAIAVLDLPDGDRVAAGTGLAFDRAWLLRALAEVGASAVQIEDLSIDGYADAKSRFNVFGRLQGDRG